MSKPTINIIPGIDWTKEDLALRTNNCVMHYPKDKKDLSKNWRTVCQMYGNGVVAINDCGEYLSVVPYEIDNEFYRVGIYKERVAAGQPPRLRWPHNYYWIPSRVESDIPESGLELRIYKDRTFTLVRRAILNDTTLYYVITDSFVVEGRTCYPWYHTLMWGPTSTDPHSRRWLDQEAVHLVTSDEEIRALARPFVKEKDRAGFNALLRKSYSDVRTQRWYCPNASYLASFETETAEIVNNFFEVGDAKNDTLARDFMKKRKTSGVWLGDQPSIFTWVTCRGTLVKSTIDKAERANELVAGVEEWDYPDAHENEAIWYRRGEYICLIVPKKTFGGWGFGCGCRKLFAYSTKTKRRLYGELSRGVWSFPVPSMSYLTQACDLSKHKAYGHGGYEYHSIKTVIKDGLSVKKLFEGSNVAWLLENARGECKILRAEEEPDVATDQNVPVPVENYLRASCIGTIAIKILATTGIPHLEQLLKANLFNLYMAALWETDKGGTEEFWDLDKKRASPDWDFRQSAGIPFHGKQKNLKKMFGMTMNQLRTLDDFSRFMPRKRSYYTSPRTVEYTEYVRHIPVLAGADKTLGVPLCDLN
ncbi:MAG: hypothetical protein II207_00650, partial [Clostridia bacterium]|nr:hypothetical protein [Clostridia bacterium]